jgi:peptide/nickel transport system ATP-binding protein
MSDRASRRDGRKEATDGIVATDDGAPTGPSSTTEGDGEPLLSVRGVSKRFAENDSLLRRLRPDQSVRYVRAVDDVSFEIRRGETLGLVGESGCGKSTLARTILGLIEPTAGTVEFDGDPVGGGQAALRAFRSDAQMIFQDPSASLNPRYTVQETLTEPMAVHGIGRSDSDRVRRAATLLERVRLQTDVLDDYPHELSGGQCQRVAIARALAVEPRLLVADEPTSALDVSVQVSVLEVLTELQAEMNLAMLFITHDLSVVRHVSDRIAVMYLGELIERGECTDVFTSPRHPYTAALLSSIPVPDPTVDRERIPLYGDVPTPVDPPSGCRFHTRCPAVIPPPAWAGDQAQWRRLFEFKTRVADGTVAPESLRASLATDRDGPIGDAALVDAIYDEHLAAKEGENGPDAPGPDHGGRAVPLPETVARDCRAAIEDLVAGDRDAAVEALAEAGARSVCEREAPVPIDRDGNRVGVNERTTGRALVRCHLRDPEYADRPAVAELIDRDDDGGQM